MSYHYLNLKYILRSDNRDDVKTYFEQKYALEGEGEG